MFDGEGEQTPLHGLAAAVEVYRARPPEPLDYDQLNRALVGLHHLCDLLQLEFAKLAARWADTDVDWGLDGPYLSPTQGLRQECQVTGHAAVDALAVGEQAATLPKAVTAMVDGRISFTKLAMLARTAKALRESETAADFDESRLLGKAERHTVSEFRRDCAHARHAADEQAFVAEQVAMLGARRLELKPCGDGDLLYLRGYLDAEGGATLRTALEPLARPSGGGDWRSREWRLADALVEMAFHSLDNGLVPQRASQRAHLQVQTSLETLLNLPGAPAGELEFAPPIAAARVQRLGCDSSVVRILLGADSAIIDVGRMRRVVAASTRRALDARDRGCVWPGCDRPASWTQAHHVLHWTKGGRTDLANLALVCHRHHWMAHEGGWQLIRTDDGAVLTIPPPLEYEPQARAPDELLTA